MSSLETQSVPTENHTIHPQDKRSRAWNGLDWKLLGFLMFLACLMFLPALGAAGIINSSDGYYTEGAREMLERGDFITPILNYQAFYEKPILTYWLMIGSYCVFGVNTFAARFPSAMCAILTVAVTFVLSRNFLRRRAAFLAALTLLCTPLFVAIGHVALTDMPLTFCITAANLLFLSVLNGSRSSLLWPAYVALGLGVLCKGPLALFVVAVTIGGYLLFSCRTKARFFELVSKLKPLPGLAILLAVTVPWFVAVHFATNGEFTRIFFVEQNLHRASGELRSHLEPWYFYLPYLLGGFFPWSILLLQSPWVLRKLRSRRACATMRLKLLVACVSWFVLTLIALHLSSAKLGSYLLPLAPPIAIFAGVYLDKVIRFGKRRFILWTGPAMTIGTALSFIFLPSIFRHGGALKVLAIISVSLLLAVIVAYSICLLLSRIRVGVILLLTCAFLANGILTPMAIAQMYRRSGASMHALILESQQGSNTSIAIVAKDSPSAAFYAKRKVYEADTPAEMNKFLTSTPKPHGFLVESRHLGDLVKWLNNSARVVDTKGDWHYVVPAEE